ncbi:SCO2523 family variant P-loop protein [Nocardia sp. FBN12]|uniref:SCO2523 family variant P-loop protein n=1 Tax=Nocardia sp. FBN12 TaxID=3419766 RepID=UPI003CFE0C3F
MIVFATSDKGGTGRSVTSCNIAHRLCASGLSTVYVDFDFGSPTAGAVFEIGTLERGTTPGSGTHSFLTGRNSLVHSVDVHKQTDRQDLRKHRTRLAKLTLLPGDEGGGELTKLADYPGIVTRCVELLLGLAAANKVVIVDLSAGRSVALELALRAAATPQMRATTVRWLVFHRWTRQHILAAGGLMLGPNGLLRGGTAAGHDAEELRRNMRFVRTAVPQLNTPTSAATAPQAAWQNKQESALRALASAERIGETVLIGATPVEPVLQWREQLILDVDVSAGIANAATVAAFQELARKLVSRDEWQEV